MDIIIGLSDLPIVRRRLATVLPHRPSHVSGAFAAGLGYASHAAALSGLGKQQDSARPLRSVPFDPAAFAAKLPERFPGADELAIAALRSCGVIDDGPTVVDRSDAALVKAGKRERGPIEEFTRSGLREVEKFALMVGTLDGRMDQTCWLLDWYPRYGQPFGLRLNRRIAAACQLHADLDPDMARFLPDAMAALDRVGLVREGGGPEGELPEHGDDAASDEAAESAFAPFKWMDDVYMAFQPRIMRFYDKVSRCWAPAHDPLLLEPDWAPLPTGPEPQGRPRYPGITVGMTGQAGKCRFDAADTGSSDRGITWVRGLAAFSLWRSGVPETQIRAFGIDAQGSHYEHPADLLGRWLNLDGTNGSQASRDALQAACWPEGLQASPRAGEERGEPDGDDDQDDNEAPDGRTESRYSKNSLRPIDAGALLAVLHHPPSVAELCLGSDERIEALCVFPGGGAVVLVTPGRNRYIDVQPAVVAKAMRAWLDWRRDLGLPVMGELERLGEANACIDTPQMRFRICFKENKGFATLHTRALPNVESDEVDEPRQEGEASTFVPTFNKLVPAARPFAAVQAGTLTPGERDVLSERDLVLSSVSHRHNVRDAYALVERGLMKQVTEPDGGYGRLRFQATYAGLRLLVGEGKADREKEAQAEELQQRW